MNRVEAPTYYVAVYMAGHVGTAERVVREYCYGHGACMTVTPINFIYTGGEETGFVVGLVNYPRFPSTPAELLGKAETVAALLLSACNQKSALLVASDRTVWLTQAPPGAA